MPEWIGQTIGKVRIEKFLDRGGTAEVYLGTHITLARQVAVKILHSYIEEEPMLLERFKREARVVAGMRHPNIVQIHDFDTIDGHPYLVMEYLKGPTLATYLQQQRKKRIPHPQVARLLNELAGAVDYAHERGVIHRDIKPGNILLHNKTDEIPLDKTLPDDVEAVLTDFGLVRLVDTGTHTTSDVISGTPAYMSPEQARGGEIDHQTDIYSLGIVLYELLAGRVPFTAVNAAALNMPIHEMQIHAMPLPIPELPARVQAVLDRALQKNPQDRHQSSRELALDFSRSIELSAEPVKIQEPEPVPPAPADLLASNNARDVTAMTNKGNQNAVATQGGRANVIHSGGTSSVFQAWRERMEHEIERLEDLPEEDKALLKQNVEQIAREAEKGKKGDMKRFERLLNTLSVGVTIKGGNIRIENTKIAGRDIIETKTTMIRANLGISRQKKELNLALQEINKAILRAPKNRQKSAQEKVAVIRQMAVSRANPQTGKSPSGKKDLAQDGILANLVTDLVDLVPGAEAAVVRAFDTPLLAEIAGPVTNFAIKRIRNLIDQ